MNPPARRYQDYLTPEMQAPHDHVADRIEALIAFGMSETDAREFIASGRDTRHEKPEHITINCRREGDHRTFWSAIWWHATEPGRTGMDMIIEQSGDIESESPDEAIAWSVSRCADIRIAAPEGGYIPLEQFLKSEPH